IDNLSSGSLENLKNHINKEYFKFIEYDLKKFSEDLVQALRDVDIVFHFAANPEVRVSSINPRIHFNENILATFNVLEASRKADVGIHVFASSSTVYGEARVIPTPEDYHPLEPISVYGAAKLACEILYITYSKLYGFKPLILRYANIIGPRSSHGVIIDFIKKLKRNPSKLEILGDGTQRKSYLHVYDAVDATLYTLKHFLSHGKNYEIYNIGNDDWITVKEIADIVVKALGLQNVKYEYIMATPDGRGWPGDVKFMLLDISKLKNIGWKPSMTSYEAVEKTARYIVEKEII
ncbi:MAG: UDP-glucose 4-epimerase, partial [Thermoprotei archaeon]